jgi:hypothetical protein
LTFSATPRPRFLKANPTNVSMTAVNATDDAKKRGVCASPGRSLSAGSGAG